MQRKHDGALAERQRSLARHYAPMNTGVRERANWKTASFYCLQPGELQRELDDLARADPSRSLELYADRVSAQKIMERTIFCKTPKSSQQLTPLCTRIKLI